MVYIYSPYTLITLHIPSSSSHTLILLRIHYFFIHPNHSSHTFFASSSTDTLSSSLLPPRHPSSPFRSSIIPPFRRLLRLLYSPPSPPFLSTLFLAFTRIGYLGCVTLHLIGKSKKCPALVPVWTWTWTRVDHDNRGPPVSGVLASRESHSRTMSCLADFPSHSVRLGPCSDIPELAPSLLLRASQCRLVRPLAGHRLLSPVSTEAPTLPGPKDRPVPPRPRLAGMAAFFDTGLDRGDSSNVRAHTWLRHGLAGVRPPPFARVWRSMWPARAARTSGRPSAAAARKP